MRHTLVAILALTAASAGNAAAQQHGRTPRPYAAPPGIILNVHAFAMPGFTVRGPDADPPLNVEMGPGLGAQVGYAFSPRFMMYAGGDIARLGAAPEDGGGHWGLGILELGGRLSFPSAKSRIAPYVTGAIGYRGLAAEVVGFGDVKLHGMALSGGGGITYAVSPTLALDGGLVLSMGKFGDYEDPEGKFDIDVDNTISTRLRFGLDWRP
jgi:hypothetical protein